MGYRRGPKSIKSIVFYIIGVALLIGALIIVLNGLGVLSSVPPFVFWAVGLVGLGAAVIAGVSNAGR